jgi:hypothetical protein
LQSAVSTIFPTLASTIARHWGVAGGKVPPAQNRGRPMFNLSYRESRYASAFGALVFAGLSFGAALYPLIAA